ncbi:hypothetical protein ACJIZ3_009442 [Penstemon smallii]|uniref:Uncharacterized protein n=1 Tax=Penstemon smallii TaxID=265156 RepID=A0ABD3TDL0_9LAMI
MAEFEISSHDPDQDMMNVIRFSTQKITIFHGQTRPTISTSMQIVALVVSLWRIFILIDRFTQKQPLLPMNSFNVHPSSVAHCKFLGFCKFITIIIYYYTSVPNQLFNLLVSYDTRELYLWYQLSYMPILNCDNIKIDPDTFDTTI